MQQHWTFLLSLASSSSWFVALRISALPGLHSSADSTEVSWFALPMLVQYQCSYVILPQSLQNVLPCLPFNCRTWPWTLECKEMSLWHTRHKMGEGQGDWLDQQSTKQVSLLDGCDISGQLDKLHPCKCPQCSEPLPPPSPTHYPPPEHLHLSMLLPFLLSRT